MSKKTLLWIIIVVVVVGGTFLLSGKIKAPTPTGGDSSGLIVGKNAIYVSEQLPGRSVSVAVVYLENPGFVVIHEDSAGTPGKILGASSLVPAGETKNVPIALSRATKDGEIIYVMLHLDDGDGKFDAAKDKPALDSVSGEPVMMVVMVSKDAAEAGEVSL